MRTRAFILLLLCLPPLAMADPHRPDWEEYANRLTCEYTIVGKKPGSNTAYYGHLSLDGRGKKLAFVRTINHVTVRGIGHFDTVGSPKNIPVLRLRFIQDGQLYHGIYQWACDYDNYMRITGYVYPSGKRSAPAGMEAFFPVPPSVRD
jgi:hypothetical protein